jgi:hypothetical protein
MAHCHFARVNEFGQFDGLSADGGASRRLSILFVVAELEAAIKLGGSIAWSIEDAVLPERAANLLSALRGQIEWG